MLLSHHMSRMTALKSLLFSERNRVTLSITSAILCSVFELISWIFLYLAVTAIYHNESATAYFLMMCLTVMGRYAFYALAVWQAHLAAYHIIQKVRQHLVRALAKMRMDKLRSLSRGDIEKRITDECQSLEPLIAHHGTDIINGLLMPLFMVGFLFYIDWRLALIALMPLPLAMTAQIWMMRGFAERQQKYNQIVAHLHQAQMEFLRTIGVMKLFAVDADSYLELSRTLQSHHKIVTGYTQTMVSAWVTFVTLAQISLILVLPVAIMLANTGQLTLIDLVMVACVSVGLLKPWLDLTQVFAQIQQSFIAIDRILPLCGEPESHPFHYPSSLMLLECRDLVVARDPKVAVLQQANLKAYPGQRITIEGASGVGKSTLLASLLGELEPTSGAWYINGQPITDIDDESRSHYLASVDQRVVFFSGSLRDNLILTKRHVEEHEIWQLLTWFGLKPLVQSLPQQLDCPIGEACRLFSGGEMQRLAIIRAAVTKAPILILDEATAHLDALSEQSVFEALRHYAPAQIQLIISHRASQIQQVDRRLVLLNGQLEEKADE
ncbi:ABC transporter permease [Vibrio qinghaiensis]|uniref:ABC transporter permease n=1 Tax=Vibrio qinghaiensis TaxID=2025808 RepID=A0A223N1M5_9VIBR|nr:ABC transporter ATP-binding protein [Vibrio qinghaiensis]ASU23781.1 ABC transporter permease [Vibrio qinghaiensis]